MTESERLYNFWMSVDEFVSATHSMLLGTSEVAVIEANPLSSETWVHSFDNEMIGRAFVEAMTNATPDPTGSRFMLVGGDIRAGV